MITTIVETQRLNPYFDPSRIEGYCSSCPNYGQLWSCPPHTSDPSQHPSHPFKQKQYALLVAQTTFLMPHEDTMGIFLSRRKTFGKLLNEAARDKAPLSLVLIAGNCYLCKSNPCARQSGQACRHPEDMRYSLEAIGYDVGGIAEDLLQSPIQWEANWENLKSLTTLGAIFSDNLEALESISDCITNDATSPPMYHGNNGTIEVRPLRYSDGNPDQGMVPAIYYGIRRLSDGQWVGSIDLRLGHNPNTFYGGNIGYQIEAPYRGQGYAKGALRLLTELAGHYHLNYLLVTCNPDNVASLKTALGAGFELEGLVKLPKDNPMYMEGDRSKYVLSWFSDGPYKWPVPSFEVIDINPELRLLPFSGGLATVYPWYIDPLVYQNSEGLNKAPDFMYVCRMYRYLTQVGEMYLIEVKNDSNNWEPVGDVCVKADNLPIVVGNAKYRRKGISKLVLRAALERAQGLGYDYIRGSEIYTSNMASIALHESLGYVRTGQYKDVYLYDKGLTPKGEHFIQSIMSKAIEIIALTPKAFLAAPMIPLQDAQQQLLPSLYELIAGTLADEVAGEASAVCYLVKVSDTTIGKILVTQRGQAPDQELVLKAFHIHRDWQYRGIGQAVYSHLKAMLAEEFKGCHLHNPWKEEGQNAL